MNEMSQEEAEFRKQIAENIFNDGPEPEPLATKPQPETGPVEDEEAPELEQQPVGDNSLLERLEQIYSQVGKIDQLDSLVRATVGRVGAIQSKLDAAESRRAAAPTAEQIAEAAKSSEKWEAFKTAWPDEAEAVESRFAEQDKKAKELEATIQDLRGSIPAVDLVGFRQQVLEELESEFAVKLVAVKHPDWKKKISTKEYREFLPTLPPDIQAKHYSDDPIDAIDLLDRFDESLRNRKTAAQIKAERDAQLNRAQRPSSSAKVIPEKAEADMTEEELRAKISREVFST